MKGHSSHAVAGDLCTSRPILRGSSGLGLVVLFRRCPRHVKPIHRRPNVVGEMRIGRSYIERGHPIGRIPPFVVVLGARRVAHRIEVAGTTGGETKPQ